MRPPHDPAPALHGRFDRYLPDPRAFFPRLLQDWLVRIKLFFKFFKILNIIKFF